MHHTNNPRSLRIIARFYLSALLAFMLCPTVVFAQSEDLARTAYRRGSTAFQSEKWLEAVTDFTAVLKLTKIPSMRLNGLYFRGYAFFKVDSCAEASKDMKEVLRLIPQGSNERQVAVAQEVVRSCGAALVPSVGYEPDSTANVYPIFTTEELAFTARQVNDSLTHLCSLNRLGGVVFTDVIPGSPADLAGLLPCDILISFNGALVSSTSALVVRYFQVVSNAEFELIINRNNESRTLVLRP